MFAGFVFVFFVFFVFCFLFFFCGEIRFCPLNINFDFCRFYRCCICFLLSHNLYNLPLFKSAIALRLQLVNIVSYINFFNLRKRRRPHPELQTQSLSRTCGRLCLQRPSLLLDGRRGILYLRRCHIRVSKQNNVNQIISLYNLLLQICKQLLC